MFQPFQVQLAFPLSLAITACREVEQSSAYEMKVRISSEWHCIQGLGKIMNYNLHFDSENEKHLLDVDQEKIQLKEGEELTITLDSIPTGGYDWLPAFNHDVIDIISHKVQRNSEKHMGGSAKNIFKFKALNSGTTTLRMVYKRNWEDSIVAEKTYSIQVMPK